MAAERQARSAQAAAACGRGCGEHHGDESFRSCLARCPAANEERGSAPLLDGLKAVDSDPRLLVSEKAGTRSFYLWGKLLRAVGEPGQLRRYPFLFLYVIFLVTLIVTVVPLSLLLQLLLRPFMRKHLAAWKQKFDLPSGSGTERMHLYGQ